MLNIWEVLGITATDSKKEIRRAYAAKCREIHPEEQPEEFQQLKDAYESALKWSAYAQSAADDFDEEAQNDFDEEDLYKGDLQKDRYEEMEAEEGEQDSLLERLERLEEQNQEKESYDPADYTVMERIMAQLSDSKKRNNKIEWRQIFLTEEFLDVQNDPGFTAC